MLYTLLGMKVKSIANSPYVPLFTEELLLNEKNINYEEIDNVYLAGGFGNYIDPHSACSINLIPEELEDKVKQIGNGAGTGAKMYLIDKAIKTFAKKLKNRVCFSFSYINGCRK